MKFTLTIDCDNAAFAPVHDDASEAERYAAAAHELRRIMRDLGEDRMAGPGLDTFGGRDRSGFLRDTNGNRCGSWSLGEAAEG